MAGCILGSISLLLLLIPNVTVTIAALRFKSSGVYDIMVPMLGSVSALLETVTDYSCSLILISDGDTIHTSDLKKWADGGRGVTVLQMATIKPFNITHLYPQLISLSRKVRQRSWCTVVVLLTYSPDSLITFAEWSLKGRLLVWATKLVVATHLNHSELLNILSSHWTFTMMNTVIINVENTFHSSRCALYICLPYTVKGKQVVQLAKWTSGKGIHYTDGYSLFPEKYKNFHGAVVNVTALPFNPFWDEHVLADGTKRYSGTDYKTVSTIGNILNFTINVVPTSSWAEVGRLVEERVSYFSPVIHNIMPQRQERYDFSVVYEYATIDFSMAKPVLRPQWQSLYYPLSNLVWASVLIMLLLTPFILILIINFVEKGSKLGQASITSHQAMTGMLLGQNLPQCLPNTNSVRVLVAAWLVGALVLVSAYRGNLTANLTLPKYPPRPETIPELVNAVDRITMQAYGAEFKNFFAKSESPLFRKLASLIYFVESGKTGQEQALLKGQAHLENRRYQLLQIAERFTRADGKTLLYIGRDSIISGQSAWPMPHDAPYKPVIDRCLLAVIEGGLYEKWNQDYLLLAHEKSPGLKKELEAVNIDNGNDGSFTPLNIVHLQGAFMVLLIGFLMSSILEVNEIVLKYLASQE